MAQGEDCDLQQQESGYDRRAFDTMEWIKRLHRLRKSVPLTLKREDQFTAQRQLHGAGGSAAPFGCGSIPDLWALAGHATAEAPPACGQDPSGVLSSSLHTFVTNPPQLFWIIWLRASLLTRCVQMDLQHITDPGCVPRLPRPCPWKTQAKTEQHFIEVG